MSIKVKAKGYVVDAIMNDEIGRHEGISGWEIWEIDLSKIEAEIR